MFQASGMLGDQKRFWATEGVLFISARFTDLTETIFQMAVQLLWKL